MSLILKTEDGHYWGALIISRLFPARSMSTTYRVWNMISLVVLLTYIQWSFETMVNANEVRASWNLKYHTLEDCLRPYNQWVPYRSLPQGYYKERILDVHLK